MDPRKNFITNILPRVTDFLGEEFSNKFSYSYQKGYLAEADVRLHEFITSEIKKQFPDDQILTMDDIKPGRSGVRAMALGDNGDVIDDFKIEYQDRSIHVLNAPSPAATASLAIGDEVLAMAQKHFGLQ